jgi:putative transposase
MLKSFKYRLTPTPSQEELINKHIGCSRFIYNLALETKSYAYIGGRKNISCFQLIKQLPDLKKECPWLKEVNSQTLQASIKNLDFSFTRFYKMKSEYPKYKSIKKSGRSFKIPQNVVVENNYIMIPKFKKGIKMVLHRKIKGVIKSATISKTPTGKYFVSILCETGDKIKLKSKIDKENTIGIDLGIKSFLTTSEGESIANPRYLRMSESRIKFVQRKYSKHKGKRTRNKLAKLHEKVANQRKDFLHKESFKLVSENQTIAIEDLNVEGMLKNHCLAKSISDASWSMFTKMLEYKCLWSGKNLLKIGRFQPSSKTCSKCGTVNKKLSIKDRSWKCNECHTKHDRDINAAVNIKNFSLINCVSGMDTKNQNELPKLLGVTTSGAKFIGVALN